MKTFRIILLTIYTFLSATFASALTKYSTYLNAFEGFSNVHIEDNCLVVNNNTPNTKITLHNYEIKPDYKIVARIANKNNEVNKSYKITNPDKSQSKVKNTTYGIVFNYHDNQNYSILELQCNDSSSDDITSERRMRCRIIAIIGNEEQVEFDEYIKGDVDRYTGYNLLALEAKEDKILFSIGKDKLETIAEISGARIDSSCQVGILSGPGSKVAVERFIVKTDSHKNHELDSKWTIAALQEHFRKSNDPYEGFWRYLDRDMDENLLRLGGRYTIALVKAGKGYDIIYVDGAKVMASKWKAGMKKGSMNRTTFQDDYDLIWYDSNFVPFTLDVSASIENASIITFKFPIQKSQIRFSRISE